MRTSITTANRTLPIAQLGKEIPMFNTIMVSYDESPEAAHALASAIELAALVRAHLKVVAVVDGQ